MSKYELISKRMAFILRWRPDSIGVKLNNEGFTDIDSFIKGYNKFNKSNITMEDLEAVVATDDKTRYSFNEDKTMIRANQGHSKELNVEITMETLVPPKVLYHGTITDRWYNIKKEGLRAMSRKYVHLTDNKGMAYTIGRRYTKTHDKVLVLAIDTVRMIKDGYKFKVSENGVWQIESVEPKYIREVKL